MANSTPRINYMHFIVAFATLLCNFDWMGQGCAQTPLRSARLKFRLPQREGLSQEGNCAKAELLFAKGLILKTKQEPYHPPTTTPTTKKPNQNPNQRTANPNRKARA